MRNKLCKTSVMARKLKNMGKKMQTRYDLEYGEKH